jgi:hypothetical protein
MFIASAASNMELRLNGTPLQTTYLDERNVELPSEWKYPLVTINPRSGNVEKPSLANAETAGSPSIYAFTIDLAANGTAEMEASYSSTTGYNKYNADRSFVYVLGPAKNWAGFGGLEIEALVPAGFQMASDPSLTLNGQVGPADRYTGNFSEVPADLFKLGFAPPGTVDAEQNPDLETEHSGAGVVGAMFGIAFLAVVIGVAILIVVAIIIVIVIILRRRNR